jgi:hypothetical protein
MSTTAEGQVPAATAGMATPKSALFNTDEAWSSEKQQLAQLYLEAAVQDTLSRLLAQDQAGYSGTPGNGVFTGMEPSVVSGSINIQPGLCFVYNSVAGLPADASSYQWGLNSAVAIPSINPNTDPSNPKLAIVYAEPEMTLDTAAATVVWNSALNPPAGAPQNVNLAQDQFPQVTFGVAYGAAAASPAMPALTYGQIPIVCVYLGAASAPIAADATYDARVILAPGAYGKHGIQQGFSLGCYNGGTAFNLTKGRAFVDGHPVILGDDITNYQSLFGCLMQTVPSDGTAYYMYLVPQSNGTMGNNLADTVYTTHTPVTGGGFLLVASTVAPTSDGHPSSAISYQQTYGLAAPTVLTTTSALFIGSVLTDGSSKVIPWRRLGDHIQLSMRCHVITDRNLSAAGVVTVALSGPPAIPASASALTLLFTLTNTDGSRGHNVAVIDPNYYNDTPPGSFTVNSDYFYMGFVFQNGSSSGASDSLLLDIPVDSDGDVWFASPDETWTGSITVSLMMAGYVEPLNHLAA